MTKEKLMEWIKEWLSQNLELKSDSIAVDRTFVKLGVDSIHAMMLVGDLEDQLSIRLSPTLAWDHPTIDSLAGNLAEVGGEGVKAKLTEEAALLENIDQFSEQEIDALLQKRLGNAETP